MPLATRTDLHAEIDDLRLAIQRAAATAREVLDCGASAVEDPEHHELARQLAALSAHLTRANEQSGDEIMLRAELATLASFAETLEADARMWRATFAERLTERAQQQARARAEEERLAAERRRLAAAHAALVDRGDVLRSRMRVTADEMARRTGGECRRTLPVVRFGGELSVCSISVRSPRRRLHPARTWLVTLNRSGDDVLVRRSYG